MLLSVGVSLADSKGYDWTLPEQSKLSGDG